MVRQRITNSRRLFARAQEILPGGVNSPVRAFQAVGGTPRFIRRGHGATLEDVDGHRFVDYVMSWGPLIHGHAPRGLAGVLAAVARHGSSFGAPVPLEVSLGERVRALMPSVERIRFVNSGTEAAVSAIRLARAATGRDKIVKFEGCYHGHGDPFLVKAGSGATTFGMPNSPGVPKKAIADTLLATYNDLGSCERVFELHQGEIAAVIVEPIAANMGVVPPANGFLGGLRALCTASGALLVFDEVVTGFRVAPGGAQAALAVTPDLTCLGKILGGGLPVGAYGGRADLMELVAPAGAVYQAGTLSGNPMAMAAGLWSLEHLSAALYRRLARLGTRLAAGLADAARDAGVAVQINGWASMLTPFFTTEPVRDYRSALSASAARYAAFFHAMLDRGIYLPPSQFEAWFLSAAHTDRDIARTVRAAHEAMRAVRRRAI